MADENLDPKKNLVRHHYHSVLNRGLYSLALVVFILGGGTVGMHVLEGFSYIDSFYFTSMIATGQGPPPLVSPVTVSGKLFTSLLAFISVGAMVASLGFIFGPLLGKLWKVGIVKFEEEMESLHSRKDKKQK